MMSFVLGGGCFWCLDSAYVNFKGVSSVDVGYMGGTLDNPSYERVCDGNTGHAEVVRITFDESVIPADVILDMFFTMHDPTQLNRQGNDVGTQYRSVIYYHNDEQKKRAEHYKSEMNSKNTWGAPVVTEISPFTVFYKAEGYHQNYYNLNKNTNPYCYYVIKPKLDKFEKVFKNKMRKN